jgi:hypothetical protein
MTITFLCLANSRKEGERCVAGIRLDNLAWFRPVSSGEHGKLFSTHYTLDDEIEASILDIIRVDVLESVPEPHQPENWLLDEEYKWELIERLSPDKAYLFLKSLLYTDEYIFGDSSDSIGYSEIEESELESSLCLIEPSDVSWEITKSSRGKRQTRAQFTYSDIKYNLVVTDPKWEALLGSLNQGSYIHNDLVFGDDECPGSDDRVLLTISLGEPFNRKCYKLVAGVLRLP